MYLDNRTKFRVLRAIDLATPAADDFVSCRDVANMLDVKVAVAYAHIVRLYDSGILVRREVVANNYYSNIETEHFKTRLIRVYRISDDSRVLAIIDKTINSHTPGVFYNADRDND